MKSSFFGNSPDPTTETVDPEFGGINPQQVAGESQWHPPLLSPSEPQAASTPAGIFPPELATFLGPAQGTGQTGGASPLQAQPLQASIKPTRPIQPLTMADFRQAITTVIDEHEGEFQSRKDDPGNYTPDGKLVGTKYGISARSFPDLDIKNLTKEQAIEKYQQGYGMFAALADQRVLTKVLDMAVNMQMGGHGPATKILQRAINASGGHVAEDGVFGDKTADAANAIDPNSLLKNIIDQAQTHYAQIEADNPQMNAWFKGWDDRAAWQPPDNKSRVQRAGASSDFDVDRAISERDRADAIRSIRLGLAGLRDQPAKPASQATATSQSKAAAVKQVQHKKK